MTRLVMLGPPGAGKGTQAQRLAEQHRVPAISTGDLFRAAAADDSQLGRSVRSYLTSGRLVPDAVTNAVVARRLAEPDAASGFVLDGFPRTIDQARELDEAGHSLDVVVALRADDEEIIKRLSGRRTCRDCGTPWHVTLHPAMKDGVCDLCGGVLYQREDDTDATIRTRLSTYNEHTAPLVAFYADGDRLVEVDAVGTVDEVAQAIGRAIAGVLGPAKVTIGPGWPWTGGATWFTEPSRIVVGG